MKIGIDARFAIKNRRGIGNYTLKLIQNLAEIDKSNQYVLYVDGDDVEGVLTRQDNFYIKKLMISNYLIWEQVLLPVNAKLDNVEILHCTGNTSPLFISNKIKLIVTIHDVSYLNPYSKVPRSNYLYQRIGRIYRKIIVPLSIKKNIHKIITVSNFAKEDICSHFKNLRKESVSTINLGVNEQFKPINKQEVKKLLALKYSIYGDYILMLGAKDPQKNTFRMVKAFIELKKEKNINLKLVLVGLEKWEEAVFRGIQNEADCLQYIIFVGFVNSENLAYLYNGAEMLVFPSLYESFGLPPLEAMSCGIPVIASKEGAVPEIASDAALLIDPYKIEEFKTAILNVSCKTPLKVDLINRGLLHAKKFSWEKMAKETLNIYGLVFNK